MHMKLLLLLLIVAPAVAVASPKLYVFDCGWLGFSDVTMFGLDNDETDVREMFVPCYLIEHADGRLLWDGGLPLAIAGKPRHEQQPGVEVEYRVSVLEQLAALDLTPQDIDLVAYSHFHFDHVGAANAFAGSKLLIQQTEWDAAFLHPEDNPVFEPALYDRLSESPKVLLNGDHDVFGDGSVRIISAPGHTQGHQTLLVALANTGKIMLSGDLYHFEVSRTLRRTPEFNTDSQQTLASMDRVERLLESENATLWIEHNHKLSESLKKAPAYYD